MASARAQALYMLIIAGAVSASPFNVTKKVGDTLPATIVTGSNANLSCYLDTPHGETIEFKPEDHSTDRIKYVETPVVSYCGAHITDLKEEDEGEWTIYYIDGDERAAKTYHLTITKAEESEEVEEEVFTEWLRDINVIARIGLNVDISLSKKERPASIEEKFTIITPDNQTLQLESSNVPGVTVHSSSDFVASRVTIGPMEESLLGRWVLCGEINEDIPLRRCQPVVIRWNNANNPSATWQVTVHSKRDTVTNYLATVDTGVSSVATLLTCHVITPNGEDLIINTDSDYPGLTRSVIHDASHCRVHIGPIQKKYLGDWTVYAVYNSILSGVTEVHLPLHLYLYDEEDPYTQAYNTSTLSPVTRVINLGTSIELEFPGTGTTDSCELRSPSGQLFNLEKTAEPVKFLEPALRVTCAFSIGPIEKEALGDWEINVKFNDRGVFTEYRQTLQIIQEDPANPIMEDHRTIMTKDVEFFNTSIGAEITVNTDLNTFWFYTTESCHIRTPDGLQYTIMDGFNVPGIEIIENSENRCRFKITVLTDEAIGEWMAISREQRSSEAVEVRQPFTIFVEENVDASSSQVMVSEGNDLHLRLANPTNLHDSCKLFDPNGIERTDVEKDAGLVETCGYILRNAQHEDSGLWHIRYGPRISYRANVYVDVKDQWESTHDTRLVFTRSRPVSETFGPENAVYCKLTDPTQKVVFEGHGRCNLALDRVTNDHAGTWAMTVGFPGNLLTRTYEIIAEVRGSEHKPIVTTYVAKEQPEVTLKCSVPVEYTVKSCLFQEPSGRVIMVNDGVAEDRYISHGTGTTMDGNVTTHECGIRITNPATSDLGLWRCAVETDHEVYYGFLTVLCPWAMQDPTIAASVVSEPTLTAHKENIVHLEGDSLTMTCSIQSPIQYCYFRRPNGMTYSVSPGVSTDEYEYVGAGLDAGECGIRFSRLLSQEAGHWPEGRWSCHVGLPDDDQAEQRANIQVQINRTIEVNQYLSDGGLMVEAEVFQQQPLEYCRYVRIDGLGFKSVKLPDTRYSSYEDLSKGYCRIYIQNPNILDLHPWTVAVKIIGREEEVLGVTSHTMETPTTSEDTSTENTTTESAPIIITPRPTSNNFMWWWCTGILLFILFICFGVLLIPAKNRRNTIARAYSWRNSIRRSFQKMPLPVNDVSRTTPMSA
ncbi:uncharacterized protein LOC106131675 [Amyelois transitella]|uniref:uncharacterized protein LOC106131675 n=1 Tax=Amyelois transitella TaxID=680683 RepID=UPI0029907F32|nr:uncharacterized protein LOC106131675 [Amyelois transitella]